MLLWFCLAVISTALLLWAYFFQPATLVAVLMMLFAATSVSKVRWLQQRRSKFIPFLRAIYVIPAVHVSFASVSVSAGVQQQSRRNVLLPVQYSLLCYLVSFVFWSYLDVGSLLTDCMQVSSYRRGIPVVALEYLIRNILSSFQAFSSGYELVLRRTISTCDWECLLLLYEQLLIFLYWYDT